ncbi:methionyl-tRNA formyltransferase [Flavobacterium psychrophilum]|uniref:Methionyl-tRNA formyltransferase n=2 Tax=Flavobacterium psychrophilum TaxID=96345 RepID=FMT_FLAPJ|nr:methionyl-tRNA formyltransferase [Flavobacterium psychrophilum]A6H148.1 RecName: Full=Methionyl-tRNA formyltransferase [Flavobacterium psychrophilum JIP02/86]AIG30757.1 methionyl-tRNA formyltransferase [Flavobacterium psychrophilum]AIG33031.1 methionyl-tRNA formyltransferase [Flavobacterium psychrophilum]AIG35187.1 methionyl-tRNA formyltransferase [Flavobacterium psychrophilum]AIG37551.1 methionyl-tRNA formyltransferase [Flavobacterium psychrophilum]AIG39816.1 methionyl-tRNA formyltransfer
MKALRIVFMGTPEFAVGILDAIAKQNKHEIVGVITAADKPAGRGQKIKYSAVKEYALKKELTLLQPTNLKDESFLLALKSLNANLHIVVAFRMLPKVVWAMPELGTFNLHASLLPNYRGAAPINWAIINGETKTGVTTFFIDDKIDTGAMILSKELEISESENLGDLHDKLMVLGCDAVLETLDKIAHGNVVTTIQEDTSDIKTAYKLDRDNCKIDFTKNITEVYNLIRGLSPYPSAWCNFRDADQEFSIKIYDTKQEVLLHDYTIGSVITTKKEIKIAVLGGFIQVLSLQFPGKKKMMAHELLNGLTFSEFAMVF